MEAQRWNQITNRIRVSEFPQARTIKAMAQALNVSVDVLVTAFARAVGLDMQRNRSAFADLLPPRVDKLTDKQPSALPSIVRSINAAVPWEDGEEEGESDSSDDEPSRTEMPGPKGRKRAVKARSDRPPL